MDGDGRGAEEKEMRPGNAASSFFLLLLPSSSDEERNALLDEAAKRLAEEGGREVHGHAARRFSRLGRRLPHDSFFFLLFFSFFLRTSNPLALARDGGTRLPPFSGSTSSSAGAVLRPFLLAVRPCLLY